MPKELNRQLTRIARQRQLSRSEFIRQAIQDKLWEDAVDASRRILVSKARRMGVYTDEDVFGLVS